MTRNCSLNYKKIQVDNMLSTNIVLNVKTKTKQKQSLYTTCCELVFFGDSMNNLFSCCGLTEARMRAAEKDLPVHKIEICQKYFLDKNLQKTAIV